MGKCKYCGTDAGFLSWSHRECRKKHKQGVEECGNAVSAYFAGGKTLEELLAALSSLKAEKFLSPSDIEDCCRRGIRQYADAPCSQDVARRVRLAHAFVNNVGVTSAALNANGELDALGLLLYKDALTSHFADKAPMEEVVELARLVSCTAPIADDSKVELGLTVLEKATHDFLDDSVISEDEHKQLDSFIRALALPVDNLPKRFQGGEIEKIRQAVILRQLQKGEEPSPLNVSLPIMLGAKEYIVWVIHNVNMYQQKVVRQWVGGNSGVSFRIAKGVYYRTGGTRGRCVEHNTWEEQGKGSLVLTNKNIIFYSSYKSSKIPYKKLIGFIPYNDGIELHKDGVNAKAQIFQGFDSWFICNFLSCINI